MPSREKMEGDVRFYDWKILANVNSETLIEVSENLGDLGQFLVLDIQHMVQQYQAYQEAHVAGYEPLLLEKEGDWYINGATAFYGGGKNYSYIDISGVNSNFTDLDYYSVAMTYLPHEAFQSAGGYESFRFYLYNVNSSLDVTKQMQDMDDNTAYSWVARKLDN